MNLTEDIKADLEAMADRYESVAPKIAEAFETKEWVARGYRANGSAQWIADNFGNALGKLSTAVRQSLVAQVKADAPDISTRGLAALTGVDERTVRRDQGPESAAIAAVSDPTPAPPSNRGPAWQGPPKNLAPTNDAQGVSREELEETAREFKAQQPERQPGQITVDPGPWALLQLDGVKTFVTNLARALERDVDEATMRRILDELNEINQTITQCMERTQRHA